MHDSLGTRLRTLRGERDVSLSELSRRSGIGKGTISELENDRRGARLDTLFALTTALDAPLGALLPHRGAADNAPVAGASVSATLLDRWNAGDGPVEVYRAAVAPELQVSLPHAPGVEETVTVVRGRVLVGPDGRERRLGSGESLRYPGDVQHRFRALDGPADVVLLMHYPLRRTQRKEVPPMSDDQQLPERSRIVQQHLHAAGLPGLVRELPDSTRTAAEAAVALDCEVGAIASSLLFLADEEPLLVMTSGRHRVDTDILAEHVGAARIHMATAKQVRAATGQAIGGVAPVGHPARVRTVVDAALADYETIWSAAGTPHTVVPMSFAQLIELTGGQQVQVAEN